MVHTGRVMKNYWRCSVWYPCGIHWSGLKPWAEWYSTLFSGLLETKSDFSVHLFCGSCGMCLFCDVKFAFKVMPLCCTALSSDLLVMMDDCCTAHIFPSRKLSALAYTIHTNIHTDINIIYTHTHTHTHTHTTVRVSSTGVCCISRSIVWFLILQTQVLDAVKIIARYNRLCNHLS